MFECAALQRLKDDRPTLFQGVHSMRVFTCQENMVLIPEFVHDALRMVRAASMCGYVIRRLIKTALQIQGVVSQGSIEGSRPLPIGNQLLKSVRLPLRCTPLQLLPWQLFTEPAKLLLSRTSGWGEARPCSMLTALLQMHSVL